MRIFAYFLNKLIHPTTENFKMLLFFELHFNRFTTVSVPTAIKILRNTGQSEINAEKSLNKLIEHGFFNRTKDWLSNNYYAPCSEETLRGHK